MRRAEPNLSERAMDEQEIEVRDDLERAFEEVALSHGLTLEYVRAIAVQLFTSQELRYAMGEIN